MDELKNLRRLMKNETFNNRGFTSKMRNNIVNEIHSGEGVNPAGKKFSFPQALSFVFIAACLSVFTYFGGTQLGMIDGGNTGSSGSLKTEISQAALGVPDDLGFPSHIPFEVSEITPFKKYSFGESTSFYRVVFLGEQDQKLKIDYSPGVQMVDQTDESLPEAVKETSVEIEAVKINGAIGNYHETRYESFLSWQDGNTSITITYEKGSSDKKAGKAEMAGVARSFQHN
jgi:hypothetical protein